MHSLGLVIGGSEVTVGCFFIVFFIKGLVHLKFSTFNFTVCSFTPCVGVCVWVCLCVGGCVRERQRERERDRLCVYVRFYEMLVIAFSYLLGVCQWV